MKELTKINETLTRIIVEKTDLAGSLIKTLAKFKLAPELREGYQNRLTEVKAEIKDLIEAMDAWDEKHNPKKQIKL